jgi:hypothetical protein
MGDLKDRLASSKYNEPWNNPGHPWRDYVRKDLCRRLPGKSQAKAVLLMPGSELLCLKQLFKQRTVTKSSLEFLLLCERDWQEQYYVRRNMENCFPSLGYSLHDSDMERCNLPWYLGDRKLDFSLADFTGPLTHVKVRWLHNYLWKHTRCKGVIATCIMKRPLGHPFIKKAMATAAEYRHLSCDLVESIPKASRTGNLHTDSSLDHLAVLSSIIPFSEIQSAHAHHMAKSSRMLSVRFVKDLRMPKQFQWLNELQSRVLKLVRSGNYA